MNFNKKELGFAIYKTYQAIEIRPNEGDPFTSHLICTCKQYQSALRIAQSAAKTANLPLLLYLSSI